MRKTFVIVLVLVLFAWPCLGRDLKENLNLRGFAVHNGTVNGTLNLDANSTWTGHTNASDPHTGYLLESANTWAPTGQILLEPTTNITLRPGTGNIYWLTSTDTALNVEFQAGSTASQWKSFIWKDFDGSQLWYMAVDSADDWIVHDSVSGNDLFKAVSNGTLTISPAGGTTNITGACDISGALSKGSGTFKIDHPLFPTDKFLFHAFAESSEYLLIYRGEVKLTNGKATVNLDDYCRMSPGTFEELTQRADVVSLLNLDSFALVRPGDSPSDGVFEILCENNRSNDTVAWVVMAERADPHIITLDITDEQGRLVPEQAKPELDPALLEPATEAVESLAETGVTNEPVRELDAKGQLRHPEAYKAVKGLEVELPTRKVTRELRKPMMPGTGQ